MNLLFSGFADEAAVDFGGQIETLKRNHFRFLEIRNVDGKSVTTLTAAKAKELAKQLSDNGLGVRSVGSPIGKVEIGDDFDAHMELFKHTLELANIFGAEYMRLFSFFMPRDENPENYRNLVLDRMGLIASTARSFGVTACHENEKGIYGDIASRCLELHRAVPELKAVFDFANFVQCGQDTLQAWDMLSPYVEYLHIKDALSDGRVVPPGQGEGNLAVILPKYIAQGGQLLSLEPHLSGFVGLKSLEREGEESLVGGLNFPSTEAAFDFAADSLKKILEVCI